jgi:hypothetical protein
MHFSDKREQVAEVERWLGTALPSEYVIFLCSHEERLIGEQVLLYAAESLIERNETYETKVYCPGYLTIGDDSGGRAVVIPTDQPLGTVYLVGHGIMSPNYFKLLPMSFGAWVNEGCPVE